MACIVSVILKIIQPLTIGVGWGGGAGAMVNFFANCLFQDVKCKMWRQKLIFIWNRQSVQTDCQKYVTTAGDVENRDQQQVFVHIAISQQQDIQVDGEETYFCSLTHWLTFRTTCSLSLCSRSLLQRASSNESLTLDSSSLVRCNFWRARSSSWRNFSFYQSNKLHSCSKSSVKKETMKE